MTSIIYKNTEILYQKTPGFWQRQSPILFPLVGGLKCGRYQYRHHTYQLPQHGFARDREFTCIFQSDTELQFLLTSDEESREQYPFDFELTLRYILESHSIRVQYRVKNTGNAPLYYSIGWHPAFHLWTDISHYVLDFWNSMQSYRIDRIHPEEKLLDTSLQESLILEWDQHEKLRLHEDLFVVDAMIFRDIPVRRVDFCQENQTLFRFHFPDFPHLGVWKQPESPFLCLEPWDGYVDTLDATGNIEDKAAIQRLEARADRIYEWSIEFPV